MMSEQIKRAIEIFEQVIQDSVDDRGFYTESYEELDEAVSATKLAIQALQAELDRQENKALTLSELEDMVGEPVWVAWENGTFCHIVDEFDYKKDMLIFTEDFASITLIKKGVTKIYKHKPLEGTDEN